MHFFNSKHKQNDLIAHDIKFYTTLLVYNICLQLDLCWLNWVGSKPV